jgi:hypothetical protein
MEILHSLHPEEGVMFLQRYWSKFAGKFEIGIATPDSEKELAQTALVAGGLHEKNRSAN